MKNNILNLVSYKLRKLKKKTPKAPINKNNTKEEQTDKAKIKVKILTLRKKIDALYEFTLNL